MSFKFWRAGLAALYLALALPAIFRNSPTTDEPAHLVAGAGHLLKGDFTLEPVNPPLARLWACLPYLILRPDLPLSSAHWRDRHPGAAGLEFLYHNRIPWRTLVIWPRVMTALLGAALVWWIAGWAETRAGRTGGVIAGALAATCPNLLGHGGLATTDLAAAATALLAGWAWTAWLTRPTVAGEASRALRGAGLVGVALGAALVTKYANLALLPVFATLWLASVVSSRRGEPSGSPWADLKVGPYERQDPDRHPEVRTKYIGVAVVGAAAALVMFLAYGGSGFGAYLAGLEAQRADIGRPMDVYLHGQYATGGFRSYYLVALLVKWPLPTLLLVIGAAVLWTVRAGWRDRAAWGVVLPPAAVMVLASFTPKQLGLRYVLQALPFLYVWAGVEWGLWLRDRRGVRRWAGMVAVGLAVWQVGSVASTGFRPLEFFNEISGGRREGWRWLADCNLDWGQGLEELRAFQETSRRPILLSYFGTVEPADHGLAYQACFPSNPLLTEELGGRPPAPRSTPVLHAADLEWLAVSPTNRAGLYYRDHAMFRWLDGMPPLDARPGGFLLYDVSGHAGAHAVLAGLYAAHGLAAEAASERAALGRLAVGEDTVEWLRAAAGRSPGTAGAFRELAGVCADRREYVIMVKVLEAYSEVKPGDPQILRNLQIARALARR